MRSRFQIAAIGVLALLGTAGSALAATWVSDFNTAQAQATANNKPILMLFTGSDWCPPCKQLKSTVLNHPEFTAYADARLILMEVDFPRYQPQAALHQQANRQLSQKYGVTGYPTLILTWMDGSRPQPLNGAASAGQLVAALSSLIGPASAQLVRASGPSSSAPTGQALPTRVVQDLPLFSGAPTRPPPVYTNLMVKSISGTPSRRFALINSETMATGDAATLKVGERRIKVRCVDIRAQSVVVEVEGESGQQELRLVDSR